MGLFIFFAQFGSIKMSLDQAVISDMAWKAAFLRKFPHLHKSMKWQRMLCLRMWWVGGFCVCWGRGLGRVPDPSISLCLPEVVQLSDTVPGLSQPCPSLWHLINCPFLLDLAQDLCCLSETPLRSCLNITNRRSNKMVVTNIAIIVTVQMIIKQDIEYHRDEYCYPQCHFSLLYWLFGITGEQELTAVGSRESPGQPGIQK